MIKMGSTLRINKRSWVENSLRAPLMETSYIVFKLKYEFLPSLWLKFTMWHPTCETISFLCKFDILCAQLQRLILRVRWRTILYTRKWFLRVIIVKNCFCERESSRNVGMWGNLWSHFRFLMVAPLEYKISWYLISQNI